MDNEKNDQPVDQSPDNTSTVEQQQTQVKEPDILPDVVKTEKETETDKLAELQKQYEKEKLEYAEKIRKADSDKEELSKRLKDNQEYISRTRNLEHAAIDVPKKTFNEYVDDVLKKFEDDPKEGIKKIITDVAFDRDLERQEYEKRITESENRAFKRILSLDPEKAKIMKSVEKLDQDRPDLDYLSFEHKVEWLNKNSTDERRRESQIKVDRERDLAGDVAGRASPDKSERLPDWANDREVQSSAKEHFSSKREMVDWADAKKAREMAKKLRPKYVNG